MAALFPTIGQWFEDTALNSLFEVVAVDDKNQTIEIQYSDGDIGEVDFESWNLSNFVPAEAPEDGNGGYGFPAEEHWAEENFSGNPYGNPLELIEPDSFQGFDDL